MRQEEGASGNSYRTREDLQDRSVLLALHGYTDILTINDLLTTYARYLSPLPWSEFVALDSNRCIVIMLVYILRLYPPSSTLRKPDRQIRRRGIC